MAKDEGNGVITGFGDTCLGWHSYTDNPGQANNVIIDS